MNRITQCMHGRGTVSGVVRHQNRPLTEVPGKYLAFVREYRPVVFWNLTDRCNLACAHCYGRSGPDSGTENELSTDEALALIDDFAAMGVPLILLSGGEPLLREDLPELARAAGERGIRTALSTNGTLITPGAARMIRDAGIGYVGISLDGASPETHDAFRGTRGAFERAMEGFARCREAGIRTGLRVTLTKENYGELAALIDLAAAEGASRFCLYWLVPSGRGNEIYDRLQVGPEEVDGALTLLYRKARETDPGAMEFLPVDAPQDCVHLLRAMERDGWRTSTRGETSTPASSPGRRGPSSATSGNGRSPGSGRTPRIPSSPGSGQHRGTSRGSAGGAATGTSAAVAAVCGRMPPAGTTPLPTRSVSSRDKRRGWRFRRDCTPSASATHRQTGDACFTTLILPDPEHEEECDDEENCIRCSCYLRARPRGGMHGFGTGDRVAGQYHRRPGPDGARRGYRYRLQDGRHR